MEKILKAIADIVFVYENHKRTIQPWIYLVILFLSVAMCQDALNRHFKLSLTYWDMFELLVVFKITHEAWSYFGPYFRDKKNDDDR